MTRQDAIQPGQRFSGSYAPEDVTFLLKLVDIETTPVAEKEALIQSGRAHYSEMISAERRPGPAYLEIFETAFARGADRIANEVVRIAATLKARIDEGQLVTPVALCSLVRAGVPYGVILTRELRALGVEAEHYGISIIRDRGLDDIAARHVRARHSDEAIVFVDGWTGKGAISTELKRSWKDIAGRAPTLVVLADPCGQAEIAGSHEDWLIPSGILGANVSGLISRSILNDRVVGPGDFHGCMAVGNLADIDMSRRFVDKITRRAARLRGSVQPLQINTDQLAQRRAQADATIAALQREADVTNINRLKPGIAEATRAVLRRKPERVYVCNAGDPDLAALLHLCHIDNIQVVEDAEKTGPWRTITLIAKTS